MKRKVVVFYVVITIFSVFTSMVYAGSFDNFKQNKTYQNNFEDVNQNDWYYENVKIAYEKGLVNGTSEKTFNPTGNITVAETITLASRLHSIYMNDDYKFVANGVWYQPYIDYAIQKGIITEEQFNNYNNKATRAQFAMIFANALPNEALNAINDITSIPDVSKNVFYANDVYKLYKAGILAGSDNYGTFNPNSNIQRSEVAAMVTRMADVNLRKNVTLDMKVSIENIQGVWESDNVIEWVFSADNTFSYSLDRGYYIYECGTYSMNGNVVTLNYNSKLYWDEDVGYKNYDVTTETITIDKINSTTMHFDPYKYDLTRKQNSGITDKLEKHFKNIGNLNMGVTIENIQGVWGKGEDTEWVFSNDNTFSYSVMSVSDDYTYYIYQTGTYSLNGTNITLNIEKRLSWDNDIGYEIKGAETRIHEIELNSTMMSLNSNILYKNASWGITEKLEDYFKNYLKNSGTTLSKNDFSVKVRPTGSKTYAKCVWTNSSTLPITFEASFINDGSCHEFYVGAKRVGSVTINPGETKEISCIYAFGNENVFGVASFGWTVIQWNNELYCVYYDTNGITDLVKY
ncbi:MAG: S-layer homology domain-containing protein [Clostridia bacterium]|nr:S-layer homology domain-containing protein [Clostridia bacterium]